MTSKDLMALQAQKYLYVQNYAEFLKFTLNKDSEIFLDDDGFGMRVQLNVDVEKAFYIDLHCDDEDQNDYAEVWLDVRFGRCPREKDKYTLRFEYFDNREYPYSTDGNIEKEIFVDSFTLGEIRIRFNTLFRKEYNEWPYQYCRRSVKQ